MNWNTLREWLKGSGLVVGLIQDLRKARRIPHWLGRRAFIRAYLASTERRKLQLGAGPNELPGWLCTDLTPVSSKVTYLDATKPFPFADNMFDFAFSEHMIEHIGLKQGLSMLGECWRVLKPGGTLRIATPDLEVLVGLSTREPTPEQLRYIRTVTDRFLDTELYKASLVINNAFHNWHHQLLYDQDLLQTLMQRVGFTDIRREAPGESRHEPLQGLESHGKRIGDEDLNSFEIMVLEGTCRK
jgi:predicted SAM-dependent methyltransferase